MKKEKVCKENYVCFKAILLLSLLIFSLNTCNWITYHNFSRFPITPCYRWHRVKFYKYQHLRLAWSVKMSVFGNNSWIYFTLLLFWLKKLHALTKISLWWSISFTSGYSRRLWWSAGGRRCRWGQWRRGGSIWCYSSC